MIDAVKPAVSDEMVELFGINFWPINAASKIDAQREHIRNALSAALTAPAQPVGAPVGWQLVPADPMPEMIGAWYRYKSGFHFPDEPTPPDTSDYGAYRAMLSAAPQPPAEGGWEPMESAPKDGTVIIAWHTVHKCPIAIRWNDEGFLFGGETLHWIERSGTTAWPGGCFSDWMPLPPAPTNGGEQNG